MSLRAQLRSADYCSAILRPDAELWRRTGRNTKPRRQIFRNVKFRRPEGRSMGTFGGGGAGVRTISRGDAGVRSAGERDSAAAQTPDLRLSHGKFPTCGTRVRHELCIALEAVLRANSYAGNCKIPQIRAIIHTSRSSTPPARVKSCVVTAPSRIFRLRAVC